MLEESELRFVKKLIEEEKNQSFAEHFNHFDTLILTQFSNHHFPRSTEMVPLDQ